MPHPKKPTWPNFLTYGTLMKGHERHHVIEPYVKFVDEVTIEGNLFNYHDAFPMWYRHGKGFTVAELYYIIPGSVELDDFYEMLDEIEAEELLFFRDDQSIVIDNAVTGYVEEYTAVIYQGKSPIMKNLLSIPSGSWNIFKAQ